ncbi:MAG: heme ABC exporter ATP-binding protein CcmA [Gemmatimonadaceae bacterium]
MNDAPILHVAGLERSFGAVRAVAGVSFSLRAGDCLALFGPNGAGKTTLLRLLAGLLRPTAGTATLSGMGVHGSPAARARIGFISHNTMLYAALSPRENVGFAARLYGVADADQRVDSSLRKMSMLERATAPVRSLSRGMQQRVSIARATVHSPPLVLADEPFTGLDEAGAGSLTQILNDLRAGGAALVVVTHSLTEGLSLASHAAIMNRGRFARFDERAAVDPSTYGRVYREAVASGG